MDTQQGTDLRLAMQRGRRAVDRYFEEMTAAIGEAVWSETDATSRLLLAAQPQVRFIPFNQNQEGGSTSRTGVGADWMWWWISPTGICFGILMQAKNIKRTPAGWTLDLHYRNQRQINDLLRTSDILKVPAAYTLYCGPPSYRHGLTCGPTHSQAPGDRCHRSGVCVLPALAAHDLAQLSTIEAAGRVAMNAYEWATPLEDLVDVRQGSARVFDPSLGIVNAELHSFLTEPQELPLAIAKKIFRTVSLLRGVRASATRPYQLPIRDRPLFADSQSDHGHFGVPYLDHVLRGLRREPPPYVAEIAGGAEPPARLRDHLAGIVIVDVF